MNCGHYDFEPATLDSPAFFIQRNTVNYLRHKLSCYEDELEHLFGKVGVRNAYLALNAKIYSAIAAAYPELADECRRQDEDKRSSRYAEGCVHPLPPTSHDDTTEIAAGTRQ